MSKSSTSRPDVQISGFQRAVDVQRSMKEVKMLVDRLERYKQAFEKVAFGADVVKRETLEKKIFPPIITKKERQELAEKKFTGELELITVEKATQPHTLSIKALQRRPPFPPGYVIRHLRKHAFLLDPERERDVPLEELAKGDPELLRMLREAQQDLSAGNVEREPSTLPPPQVSLAVLEERYGAAVAETEEKFEKRSVQDTARSLRQLMFYALAAKGWIESGKRLSQRKLEATELTIQTKAKMWNNPAFIDQITKTAGQLGLSYDAQEQRIKHLEYIRYLNYKQTLANAEENLRNRNLLAGVDLHDDEDSTERTPDPHALNQARGGASFISSASSTSSGRRSSLQHDALVFFGGEIVKPPRT